MKISSIFLVPILMLVPGCVSFDYGVLNNDPQLLQSPNDLRHEPQGYQFWSRIFDDPSIEITHARYPSSNPSILESILTIGSPKSNNVTILSVVLEHRDQKNNLIQPTKVNWASLPAKADVPCLRFAKTYDKVDFPGTVIETIRIELLRGSETEVLEYRFILKKRMSGTFWDEIMSV